MGHLSVSLSSDTWFVDSDNKMAGAYRFLAVLIAELSLTLAQLPQELSPGNAPNVNLQFNTPFSASGLPGFHEGYTEMPPANPLFSMRFGFRSLSDSLIGRGLPPIPSSSETTAHNRPPISEVNNPTHDYSRYQTVLDQPSRGVSSEQVPHPYFPNNLGFSSPLGIPGLRGLENPFVPTNIFDTRNVSNQPDMFTFPISFGLSNTFGIPLHTNTHNFNNFPGTIPRLPATYKPEENSDENFTQTSDEASEDPIEKTQTKYKEDFLNFLDNFYNFSPLPSIKSESNSQQVPGLYSAPSFAMTPGNFEQIHSGLFPLGAPIVPGLSTERRFPHFANAFPGPMSIKSNLNNDFPAIPDLPTVQLHSSITASRNINNFNSPIMMNPDKNMQGFHPYIPGLTFPPMLDFNNIDPTFPHPFNNLTPEESKKNKTKPQPMPGLFQLPPLGITLENNFNSPIMINPDKNMQDFYPYIPGLSFPPELDFNNIGQIFTPPLNNLISKKNKTNKIKSQLMPGLLQLPPLGIPLEYSLNSPVDTKFEKNNPSFFLKNLGLPFPSNLYLNSEVPMFKDVFHNIAPKKCLRIKKRNETKTTPQMMPGLFQLPPLGIPLENYSPIQPYGLGPGPLLPQDFFEHLDTVTPENTFSPFGVLHPPFNLPIIFPDLPTPFLHLKGPGASKINPSNVDKEVVDCMTVEMPDTVVVTEPPTPPTITVVTPPATTSVYSTTSSPSTVASTTTTTTIPTTTATTPPPTATTTVLIPSTMAPTTTSVSNSTMEPTTQFLSPSTLASTTSPSSTAAPTNTTRPPTTIYTLLTSTTSLFSSNVIKNTTAAN